MLASVLCFASACSVFRLCFLSCVFGFRIRLLFIFCVALGSELLGLGFHAGSDSVAVWVRLGFDLGNATANHYLLFTQNLKFNFKRMARGLGDRPGREVGDSVLPHGERLHFGILSVSRFERFLCLYAVGVGLIRLRVVVGRFCSFLTVFCFACLLEMLIAGLGVLQGRYGCISYSG
ncbi:TPA: hypothetical protein NWA32_004211 [Escherichia coli]|nr:hypothetical protein [Escherichia coli]